MRTKLKLDYRNERIVWFDSGRAYLLATVDGRERQSYMGRMDFERLRRWCGERGIPFEVGRSDECAFPV